jgi:hypothetical protein
LNPADLDLIIGCLRISGSREMYFFKGKIDEVKIHRRILSGEEVKAEYDRLAN